MDVFFGMGGCKFVWLSLIRLHLTHLYLLWQGWHKTGMGERL